MPHPLLPFQLQLICPLLPLYWLGYRRWSPCREAKLRSFFKGAGWEALPTFPYIPHAVRSHSSCSLVIKFIAGPANSSAQGDVIEVCWGDVGADIVQLACSSKPKCT